MPPIRRRRPKKKPKPIGRPPHKPTDVFRRQVLEFKGMGMTHDQIGKMIGISDETLRKHYDYELNIADAKMNVNVANNLYTMATDPEHKSAVTAAIFWLKTRGGDPWREIKRTELTGKDGKPLMIDDGRRDVIDSSDLTPEQRQALRQIITQAVAQKINEVPDLIEGDYEDVTDGDEYEYEEDEE